MIKKSFDSTGIMSSNEHNFNSVLRNVLENSSIPGTVVDVSNNDEEINGFDSSFIAEDDETDLDEYQESDHEDEFESEW